MPGTLFRAAPLRRCACRVKLTAPRFLQHPTAAYDIATRADTGVDPHGAHLHGIVDAPLARRDCARIELFAQFASELVTGRPAPGFPSPDVVAHFARSRLIEQVPRSINARIPAIRHAHPASTCRPTVVQAPAEPEPQRHVIDTRRRMTESDLASLARHRAASGSPGNPAQGLSPSSRRDRDWPVLPACDWEARGSK